MPGCGSSPEEQAKAKAREEVDAIVALGPDQAAQVQARASGIEDPILRTTAVMGWLEQNQQRIDPSQGQAVCQVLVEPGRSYCQRRAASPHLREATP